MSIFAARLKELRLERGEKQSDVAEFLGVSVQSYSAYEGAREPKYDFLCKLAEHYSVTVDYLLGATNLKMKPEQVSAAPEAGKLIGAITGKVVPFFSSLGEWGPAFSDLFSEYILDGVKDAVERCRQCYQVRDSFKTHDIDKHGNVTEADAIDVGLVELFLWPKQYRKMTQEELRQLYPRDKRMLTVDPDGKPEWI